MEEEIVNWKEGVEVPIPKRVLPVPALGKMASTNEPVEVANLVSGAPEPVSSVSQPNDPPAQVSTLLVWQLVRLPP